MAPDQPLQVSGLLRTLDAHGVEFVIIGGIAVGLHGHARATKDLDSMIEPSAANVARLWAISEDVDAEPLALDDVSADELPLPFEPASILEGGNLVLQGPRRPIVCHDHPHRRHSPREHPTKLAAQAGRSARR